MLIKQKVLIFENGSRYPARVTRSKYKRNKTLPGLVDLMKHLNLTQIERLKIQKNVNLPGVGEIVSKKSRIHSWLI